MQNVDRIIGNEVQVAFSQLDILKFRSNTEDLSGVKTLFHLHPEQVHILALAAGQKQGGVMGIGAKEVVLNTLDDLAGKNVVAYGGSYITAQVIKLQTMIPFNVVEVADAKAAIEAVNAGQAAAAIIVGGAPMDNLKTLNKAHKLLSIPEASAAKLKNVYKPAVLNYSNLGAAGVQTVSVDSVVVTREYKTPKVVEQLVKLRTCFNAKAAELAETAGMHMAWSKIKLDGEAKWPVAQFVGQTKK
jgi:TRAP-type uncharacterized transport system substrate-binding protein